MTNDNFQDDEPSVIANLTHDNEAEAPETIDTDAETVVETPAETSVTQTPTPIFDSRVYDGEGKQVGGSVYYTVEELARGKKELENSYSKLKNWANKNLTKAEQLEAALQQAKNQPIAQQPTPQTTPAPINHTKIELSPQLKDILGDEAYDILQQDISRAISPLFSEVEKAKALPQQYFQQITQEQKAEQQILQAKTQINELATSNPELYLNFEDALIAEKDPQHPDYDRAMNLVNLVGFSQDHNLSIQEAHKYLQLKNQPTPTSDAIQKAKEDGIKLGQQQAMESLKKGNARPVVNGELGKGIGKPEDFSKLSPQEKVDAKFSFFDRRIKGQDFATKT